MSIVDELANGAGRLRVSLLGIPPQTQTGPETTVGKAMRYLAELPWAPQVVAANREPERRAVDERAVEVRCEVGADAAVRWELDGNGDRVRATGVRPRSDGKSFVPTRWGGDFGDYRDFAARAFPPSARRGGSSTTAASSTGAGASPGSRPSAPEPPEPDQDSARSRRPSTPTASAQCAQQ